MHYELYHVFPAFQDINTRRQDVHVCGSVCDLDAIAVVEGIIVGVAGVRWKFDGTRLIQYGADWKAKETLIHHSPDYTIVEVIK